MATEDTITITESAPDGTETVIEITATKPDDVFAEGDKTLVEEVVEAIFDDQDPEADTFETTDDQGDAEIYSFAPTEQEITSNSVEFTIGEDLFPTADVPFQTPSLNSDYSGIGEQPDFDPEVANMQAHADAAAEAQATVDDLVAQGDYTAAADAREIAENEAWEAGDSSMLGTSDTIDLDRAAINQEDAEYYTEQQAEHIEQGDFEAAKADAQNVAYATDDADHSAGGDDHTDQAENDIYNLDNAAWNDKIADGAAVDAAAYAAEGDLDTAAIYADTAAGYEGTADTYAAAADPVGDNYQADASAYDVSAVDTGFDSGIDMTTPTTFDTTADDI